MNCACEVKQNQIVLLFQIYKDKRTLYMSLVLTNSVHLKGQILQERGDYQIRNKDKIKEGAITVLIINEYFLKVTFVVVPTVHYCFEAD